LNIKGIDIKLLREKLNQTQEEFGNLIGVSGRTIINYEKGNKIPESKTEILLNLWNKHMKSEIINSLNEPPAKYIPKTEAKQKDDSEFMEVAYLPRYAQAGYLDSILDESVPDVETKLVPKEYEKGNYLIVEITGDSMDDGTKRSIMDGDSRLKK